MNVTDTTKTPAPPRARSMRKRHMTERGGQVFASTFWRLLLGVSSAAIGAVFGLGTGAALAGSCTVLNGGGGSYECSGAADSANDTLQFLNETGPLNVTTTPGFGMDMGFGWALRLEGDGVTFTDIHNSSISTSGPAAIFVDTPSGSSGDVTISSNGTMTGLIGIDADSDGSGSIEINANNIVGLGNYGILTYLGADGEDLSVTTTGSVVSRDSGISARSRGTGSTTILAVDVHATYFDGIIAVNRGTDLSITSTGTVYGGRRGIYATNDGAGTLSISAVDVQGESDHGIFATNEGSDLSITATGTVSGGRRGINATNDGTGALSVSAADVRGVDDYGIFALNNGTDLSIATTGAVDGTTFGIYANNRGSGALSVSAVDADSSSAGILAVNSGTDLSVTATGSIFGGDSAIYAHQLGSGVLSIAASGNLTSTSGHAIYTQTNPDQLTVIDLLDGASVSSQAGLAIYNDDGDSMVTLHSGSSLAGSVELHEGQDLLTIEGGADISQATLFDGGGGSEDALVFSGYAGVIDGVRYTNWETLTAQDGSDLTLDSSAVGGMTLVLVDTGAIATALNPDFAYSGDLQVNATGRFLAGALGAGNVTLGGAVINDGLISTADGYSGDRLTFGFDLSGSGTLELDIDLTSGTNDEVFVTGNSTGANMGLQVDTIGSGNGTEHTFTLVTVAGDSLEDDFQLVNADFVTNDGAQAISDGDIAYRLEYDAASGTFQLNPINSSGGVNENPGGDFLAANVQQVSDHMVFGTTLQRIMGATRPVETEANTVSRALSELTTSKRPLIWAQAEGRRDSYSIDDRDVVTTSGGIRFGAGLPLAETADGILLGGLEFGVSSLYTDVSNALTGADIDTDAYDATLSALWISNSQLYVDGQFRYAYFDSSTRPNGGNAVDTSSAGYGLSVEVGKPIALQNQLTLIPQGQLMYSDINTDDVTDLAGGGQTGSLMDGDTLTARLGLRAERMFAGNSVLYAQADYYHSFDNQTAVAFGQDSILTERAKNTAALTVGANVALSARTTLYGEISGETGLGSSSGNHALGGNIGIEIRF